MINCYLNKTFILLFLTVINLDVSAQTSAYDNHYSNQTPQGIKPGVSDDAESTADQKQYKRKLSRKEAIAQLDSRDQDIHKRAYRLGDWDYKANWRYDRKAFYGGGTQAEAIRDDTPYGPAGIGYEAEEYKRTYRSPRNNNNQNFQSDQNDDNNYNGYNGYNVNHTSPNTTQQTRGAATMAGSQGRSFAPTQSYHQTENPNYSYPGTSSSFEGDLTDNYHPPYSYSNSSSNNGNFNDTSGDNSKRKRPDRYNRD